MSGQRITGRDGADLGSVETFTQSLAGDLVLTRADDVAQANGDRYALTHRLSGFALGWFRNKRTAEQALDLVSLHYGAALRRLRTRTDWRKPTARCKALGREVQSLIGMVRGDGNLRSL
jgi:hypothetical protein